MIKLNSKDLESKSRGNNCNFAGTIKRQSYIQLDMVLVPSLGRQKQADPYEFEARCTIDWAMARVL